MLQTPPISPGAWLSNVIQLYKLKSSNYPIIVDFAMFLNHNGFFMSNNGAGNTTLNACIYGDNSAEDWICDVKFFNNKTDGLEVIGQEKFSKNEAIMNNPKFINLFEKLSERAFQSPPTSEYKMNIVFKDFHEGIKFLKMALACYRLETDYPYAKK
ncbi:hypothetical protein GTO89_01975 [Heliobacterium gestii]|uniref:Uncharacterized protein n=1 Tax=Heliomicrobium gestii TaxID=2699 RepID=A0A845L6G0_HELGE|nr:hypothetical protein [Heliomicrobium gestii]MBM7865547.1 hypothetical protein [Heliomicrobium gestii]MZP41798.1 hypothetical protein [Heliomicrobium gestii]